MSTNSEQPALLIAELVSQITERKISNQDTLNRLKLEFCEKHELSWMPKNSDILSALSPAQKTQLAPRLRLKKVRSISGVNVIGVMSSPRACPHGRCVFCPMEKGFPMSYTSGEPAAMRGIQYGYDPYEQINSRINQLKAIGHEPSKVELVIQGGTFLAAPLEYQNTFIKRCFDALNHKTSSTLEEAKKLAETSEIRNVGLTIETKPDWCKEEHVDQMLRFGATRVEIGVQLIDDRVYKLTNRGHDVADVVDSFQISKDAGLKVVAHMMPGLPGSDFDKDLQSFKLLFEDERFCPDMLKIYPCLVMEGTQLYEWWKNGHYTPYDTEQAVELIARVKKIVPPWIRIMRVHREFPVQLIIAGVKKGNLRELALERLKSEGKKCRCIRCREVRHRALTQEFSLTNLSSVKLEYHASGGVEVFLSKEDQDQDILVGYIRIRLPSSRAHRHEIDNQTAIVRELHIYGPEVPVGKRSLDAWQHKGLGQELLAEAEDMAKERGVRKILVMSAIGTRAYYAKSGYNREGPYMGKRLSRS